MEQQGETIPPMEQYDDARDTPSAPEPFTFGVFTLVLAVLIGFGFGCILISQLRDGRVWAGPNDVTLTGNERRHAVEMEIHRQNIQFMRNNANSNHTAILNRLNEEDEGVQQDQVKFLFALKQAHELDPSKNYSLDAWRGKLVQQK